MRDQDYTDSVDFLKRLFSETLHKVELRACPNVKGEPGALSQFVRADDDDAVMAFLRRKDVDGIGSYFGVCTRRDGAESGNLASVVECPALWVDIDCVQQRLTSEETLAALNWLPHPPSIIINSGGGLHAYWLLEEAGDVSEGAPDRERLTAALRALAGILAGDMKCAELARIMRVPGTMNSKDKTKALYDGEPALCSIIGGSERVHDLDTLCEWLSEQRAVLHSKAPAEVRPVRENDPFVAYAQSAGFNPSLDIDAELAAMSHEAPGLNGIHATQLRVSASMIARGYEDDEIVNRVLAATEAAAPRDQKWNWNSEERAIRKMVASARAKGFAEKREDRPQSPAPLRSEGNLAVVHDLKEERAKREPKEKRQPKERTDEISILGGAVLDTWQQRYGPIILSRGTSFAYEDGVWETWDERHDQMLRVMMQEACASLNLAPKTSLINAATLYFLNRPALLVRDAEFDAHGLIIAGDGTIDPRTGDTGPHSPEHRAMFKVGASITGERDCPAFLAFLRDSFADKASEEVEPIILTLQEWFGASLVPNKPRALAKGMLVHGGSRTGKTQLSEILRAMLGRGQTAATSVADLGTDFGLQSLLGKRGWIADDAIGEGETLDAERYKKIVTGEEVGVRRKNRTEVMARFGFPVMLTANHLPRIKDQSDAVYNRSLVLPMTNVRPETAPEPIGYDSIAKKVVAEELTGVLWWAIEGWNRLRARGRFDEPACMRRAVTEMQDNNNPVGTWLKECVALDSENKVAVADLFGSFAGWFYQENGDGKFLWSQNKFKRRLTEAMPQLVYQKGLKTRNLCGLRLNDDGLEYWEVNSGRSSPNSPGSASVDRFSVNQVYDAERSARVVEVPAKAPADRTPRF